ncbi:hypothetical protein RYZ26_19360 [Terasakiella sp. A23]|nr:hypothetical protein [Terasakiella sp. A23]MDV7341768.1 hypothetical protein [Terasakiella sp. A23]
MGGRTRLSVMDGSSAEKGQPNANGPDRSKDLAGYPFELNFMFGI